MGWKKIVGQILIVLAFLNLYPFYISVRGILGAPPINEVSITFFVIELILIIAGIFLIKKDK